VSLLKRHERDRCLPAAFGDPDLCLPDAADVLALVHEHLCRPGTAAPIRAELEHARWKPGVAVSGLYALHYADDSAARVVLKLHRAGKAGPRASSAVDPRVSEHDPRLRPWVSLGDGRGSLWSWIADRELRGLVRLHDRGRTKRWLSANDLFPGTDIHRRDIEFCLLRYKPERRAVVRLDIALRRPFAPAGLARLIARVLPPLEARRVATARSALDATGKGPWPRLLGAEAETGILIEEYVEHAVPNSGDDAHAELAGRCLAALHARTLAARVPATPRPSCAAAIELLARCALAPAAEPACASAAAHTWVHGDVHADQVVGTASGGVLLDLDQCGAGDPLEDLATWIADAQIERGCDAQAASRALMHGYRAGGGGRPAEVELAGAVARALIQAAAAVLRRLEVDAIAKARHRIELAGTWEAAHR
jgi:hypothetical protein